MKNSIYSVIAIALTVLTSACGNMSGKTKQVNGSAYSNLSGQSNYGSNYGSNPYSSQAEQCSPNPNIVASAWNNNLDSQYRACTSGSGVKVFSEDDNQKNICFFPAKIVGGQIQTFVTNPYATPANRFAVQCTTLQQSGSVFSFSNLNFNAGYIVSTNDAAVFATCMSYGDIAGCASQAGIVYSFGQFR